MTEFIILQGEDICTTTAQCLVNPVNTEGVMGAGLAAKIKKLYPENYKQYRKACLAQKLAPGMTYTWTGPEAEYNIINLATKDSWRNPSKLEWITRGLEVIANLSYLYDWESIAIPKIGCGLGGLDWKDVKPLILHYLRGFPGVVYIYE